VHAQSSDYGIFPCRSLRNRVAIGIDLQQLPAAHQSLQKFRQFLARRAMNAQFPHQLLKAGAAFRLAFDFLQNGGIGKSVHDRGLLAAQIIIRDRMSRLLSSFFF